MSEHPEQSSPDRCGDDSHQYPLSFLPSLSWMVTSEHMANDVSVCLPQNPSESEKDDGLAQTGDVTSFLPAVVAGAAGLTAAAVALTLRRRSK